MPAIQVFKPTIELSLVLGMGAIAYLGACLLLWLRQGQMIFFPSPALSTTPANLQIDYEDVWLPVSVGVDRVERLHGWWIPAPSTASRKMLLFLHGNSINMGINVDRLARFHQLGFSVLSIDYRGFGCSDGGFPTESTVYRDAQTAWNYLVGDRGVLPEEIVIYGYSLGGAIAIELAKGQQIKPAGLIIEGSFTSMRDMVDYRHPRLNIFPIDLLLRQKFDSLSKLRALSIPLLFIHGLDDDDVPAYMSQQLFDAASEPKQLLMVPGAGHENVGSVNNEDYLQAIRQFSQLGQANQVTTNH